MTQQKKEEVADKILQTIPKAVKIRETLCEVYHVKATHFSDDDFCSFQCPFFQQGGGIEGDIDKDFCTQSIGMILAVDCIKTLV